MSKRHLFLAGFMGSGKSTVGPLLARVLGMPFVDLDLAIEARAGMKIREIFEKKGEPAFRALESEALEKLAADKPTVVALGGGALLADRNRATIGAAGTSIYLRATVDSLAARLEPEVRDRPVLAQGKALSLPQLRDRVSELLSARSPLYGLCDHAVDTDGLTPEEIAARIARAIGGSRS